MTGIMPDPLTVAADVLDAIDPRRPDDQRQKSAWAAADKDADQALVAAVTIASTLVQWIGVSDEGCEAVMQRLRNNAARSL